jgi:hypothetical protein
MASKLTRGDLRASGLAPARPTSLSPLNKNTIAKLPIRFISEMSRDDLIRVIRTAELPLVDARALPRLPYLDRAALERLAHLARRCCRTWRAGGGVLGAGARSQGSARDSFWEDMQ